MITTDAPGWLRRSDQAVTWARTMLTPAAPSSSTARQQICRGALLVTTVIRTCGIACERDCSIDGKPYDTATLISAAWLSGGLAYPVRCKIRAADGNPVLATSLDVSQSRESLAYSCTRVAVQPPLRSSPSLTNVS